MAANDPTVPGTKLAKGVLKTEWVMTATGDTFNPLNAPNYPDKTVQWHGTQANAVVSIAGSNNTATGPYTVMHLASGAAAANSAGAAKIGALLENPLFIRPQFTTATAAATRSLKITIISQGPRR